MYSNVATNLCVLLQLDACSQLAAVFHEAGVTVDHAAALLTDAMKDGSPSTGGTQPAPNTPPPTLTSQGSTSAAAPAPASDHNLPQLSSLTYLVVMDAMMMAADQGMCKCDEARMSKHALGADVLQTQAGYDWAYP
jgi:hypothetical protein